MSESATNKRLFIAIELSPSIKLALSTTINAVATDKRVRDIKWVDESLMHITLQFIGDRSSEEQKNIESALSSVRFDSFSLSIGPMGTFPKNPKSRANVLWTGIDSVSECNIANLKNKVVQTLGNAITTSESKESAGHITLGRIKSWTNNTQSIVDKFLAQSLPSTNMIVNSFCLYSSVLTKSGPIYKEEARYLSKQ